MDLSKLKEPFPASDVEWRIGLAGKNTNGIWARCLAYVTNRAIMERLDEVVGPERWTNEYREAPAGGVLCGLSIRVGDEWITKWDGADNTDMEPVKGGLSGAMKRAGVQWGIGRYLYDLPECWATVSDDGRFYGRLPEKAGGGSFHWDPPGIPDWALPGGSGKPDGSEVVDRRTGEIRNTHATPADESKATVGADDMIPCPKCDGAMWDNRSNKRNPKSPDLKCKNGKCGEAIWLNSWSEDLYKELAAAFDVEAIDLTERVRADEAIGTNIPRKMLAVQKWLAELASGAGI